MWVCDNDKHVCCWCVHICVFVFCLHTLSGQSRIASDTSELMRDNKVSGEKRTEPGVKEKAAYLLTREQLHIYMETTHAILNLPSILDITKMLDEIMKERLQNVNILHFKWQFHTAAQINKTKQTNI